MRYIMIFVLLLLGLLAVGIACGGSADEAPTATGTPAPEATETVATEPTLPPLATATLPGPTDPTSTPRPQVEGPCPIDHDSFCDFAEGLDASLRSGDVDFVLARSTISSEICPADMLVGECRGLTEGTLLSGYFVVSKNTDGGVFLSASQYRSTLEAISQVDLAARDNYGDSSWRLAAIIDRPPFPITLVSTTIGPDSVYQPGKNVRRVFYWNAYATDGRWELQTFWRSIYVDEELTGVNAQGTPIEGWLPWGKE